MGTIKKHKRSPSSGGERTYNKLDRDKRRPVGVVNGSLNIYRTEQKNQIVRTLKLNSSLLVIGESGCGKSFLKDFVVEDLQTSGFQVVVAEYSTTKEMLVSIAKQLNLDTESLEGKALKIYELQEAIAEFLRKKTAFLIFDDAHRLQPTFRYWLERLHAQDQPMLLFAVYPPIKDIFVKLPRIEVKPLSHRQIREIMIEAAAARGIELTNAQLSNLQQRCGNNPMLAKRVISEEHSGVDETNPDHIQWIDGTPLLIGLAMTFVIVRLIGSASNSLSLYLLGVLLTVVGQAVSTILQNLPRKSGRLGR